MTLVLIVPGWLWLWQYLSPISKNNKTDNADNNDRRGGVDWTWAGVRKAVMADGDGRREVDIVIVICHFSTLMLNYILFVQLYTMCVGLPTVFKAVPSTYPADNFTPACPNSFPNHRLWQISGCMHTGAGHPIHPQVDDLRQSQSESSLFLSYMAHYSINYVCVCKHKLWLNSQQNSLTINLIFLKAWPWG